jgi:hypothetical protein
MNVHGFAGTVIVNFDRSPSPNKQNDPFAGIGRAANLVPFDTRRAVLIAMGSQRATLRLGIWAHGPFPSSSHSHRVLVGVGPEAALDQRVARRAVPKQSV